jgi:Na+-transporting methylmalonyl-CoA/oxaloacetate decarboxylase gamma subunit
MIVLYILLILIALVLIISALMPSAFNIEKSTVINKPINAVMGGSPTLMTMPAGIHGNNLIRQQPIQ